MGIVYLAMARGPGGFNKLVVIKELKPELVEEPAFLTMFLDEARLAARLSHPNIVQTNEVGNDGNRYFMSMDYLDGRSLDRARRRAQNSGWAMSLAMQLRIICDVLSGLDYAHRLTDFNGTPLAIVHRDISPSNIFLTFDGQVKLLDFGIAKTTDSSQETRAGVLKGKLSYMAPEQARGERVDARADIFAVGVLLWEALTGRRLRNTQNEYEVMRSLVAGDLPRASSINPEIPHELDEICAHALAHERDARYPSAAAFRNDLERFIAKEGLAASPRDLGTLMAEMFHDDRASTNALIEAHVARARAGAEREDARAGVPTSLPIIPSSLVPSGLVGFTPSRERPSPTWGQLSPPPAQPPTVVQSDHASAAPSGPHTSTRARGRSLIIPGVAIGMLAVVAFVYVAFFMPGSHVGPPAGKDASRTIAAAIPTDHRAGGELAGDTSSAAGRGAEPEAAGTTIVHSTPDEDLVDIEVRVTPSDATVTIDGAEVLGRPFHGKFVRGEAIRQIRASAPGYLPKTHALAFNANVKIDLSLERKARVVTVTPTRVTRSAPAPRPDPPPRAPDPPPPAAAPADVNPNGGTKPRRPIDPANPYGAE